VPLTDRRGGIIGTMGISHNITERKKAEDKISFMALHDSLTGLPNRILLEDRLAQAIALARRNQKRVAVLMLDLDRFKNINDIFGHAIGDRLLVAISRRLKGCLRESDIVARLGGDEFVVGVPIDCDNDGGERVAQKILTAFVDPIHVEGRELRVNASIGICVYPVDGGNPEVLLQSADAAMYEAKKKRRGTYCLFAKELIENTRNRQILENDLRQACARGEFLLHYQPLVSTDSGRITGVEALLRWCHPLRGLIPPGDFIPQLEDLGLMEEVGQWVLRNACLQNRKWQEEGLPPIRVAVNLSAQQFYWGDIAKTVKQVLHETRLDPQWLELELTETLTLDASENTAQIMHELKKIGVSLSLDDFGTGWSSLSYLSRFPLDRLKIDRSFMRGIASQPASQAIVESIVTLGRSLGLTCIGEGVETNEQLEFLRGLMCPEIQGFLYSPPLPEPECTALLHVRKPIRSMVGLNEMEIA
jgi:diguanylate cyclase (GGDEF)-like protein